MCICIYVYLYRECIYAYMFVWMYKKVHMCVCMHMYVHVYMHRCCICTCAYIHIKWGNTCTHIKPEEIHTHTSNKRKYIGVPYVFVLSFQVDFMLNKIWSYDSYFFWNSHIVCSQQYLYSWIWHQYPSISMDQQEFTDQTKGLFFCSIQDNLYSE